MSVLNRPHFQDEGAAFDFLEATLWPKGPVCSHCGATDRLSKIKANPAKRIRHGLHKCGHCGKQFRVTIGTVFEQARIPLHKILQAVHLLCSAKKGISSHELHRILEVQYKTAWFLSHRIRLAMETGEGPPPLGGLGAVVEVDETCIGKQDHVPHRVKGYWTKNTVLTLVERGGSSRSFHVDGHSAASLAPFIRANVSKHSVLSTDEGKWYSAIGTEFLDHVTVNHGEKEWKRGHAHAQTVEGFFSVFKRGMKGVYQHCSEKHLHRYLAEFDFRYSNRVKLGVDDSEGTNRALMRITGKRLKYKGTDLASVTFELPSQDTIFLTQPICGPICG